MVAVEAQNVPFHNSYIQVESENDTFSTIKEQGRFPKFGQEHKFLGINKSEKIEVSIWSENTSDRLGNSITVSEFEDQKLHDKWIRMINPETRMPTDTKIRLIIHFVYSKVALCEEAISGWKQHIHELKSFFYKI